MRNSRPFVLDFIVVMHRFAVIHFVEFKIFVAHHFRCERLSLFHKFVGDLLEFRKHSLTVHCCAQHVQVVLQQIFFDFHIRYRRKQVLQKQHFVAGGRHFRHKNFVVGFGGRLRLFTVIGVHGVSHFVGDGENVVSGLLVV